MLVFLGLLLLAWNVRRALMPSPTLDLAIEGRVAVLPLANETGEKTLDWIRYGEL